MAATTSDLTCWSLILYPTARMSALETWGTEQLTEAEARTPRGWSKSQSQTDRPTLLHARDVERRCEWIQPGSARPQMFSVPSTR